eukprot:scaffold33412_cov38-Prasinocladus_malaysianus.AAC.1
MEKQPEAKAALNAANLRNKELAAEVLQPGKASQAFVLKDFGISPQEVTAVVKGGVPLKAL